MNEKNLAGYTEIVFSDINNKTITKKTYASGASKVSPAIFLTQDIPCYYLIQLGGGYVEGELYKNKFVIENKAKATITTQAPNKIYKCENGIPSRQDSEIRVGKDSYFEYLNDVTILYKDAIYYQKNDIYLEENSTLIYTDGITSGWSPDGKLFQYTDVKMETSIYMKNRLIFRDKMRFTPQKYQLQQLGIMENYKNFGSMIMISPKIDKIFVKELKEYLKDYSFNAKIAISLLEYNGIVVRILSNLSQDIFKINEVIYNYFREKYWDMERLDLRKY